MNRKFNLCAGPAALPEAVLARAQSEMLDWHGEGLSVMEMSHRSSEMVSIASKATVPTANSLLISYILCVILQGAKNAFFKAVKISLKNDYQRNTRRNY